MLEHKGYVGVIAPVDGVFAGRVVGLRDVVTFEGETVEEVETAFRESVDDYLAFCAEEGGRPDKPYSGKISLRTTPELHRKAVLLAHAEGVSLNRWISRLIENAV